MSVEQLEAAAEALGELNARVVFMGGASVALWLTDAAGRRPRVTDDVDVIAEVATLAEYAAFQEALRARGFAEDIDSGVMARWQHAELGVVLDAVPAAERLAGFSDRWLSSALSAAIPITLPSGTGIRAIPPPWLIVLKLEAFKDRGDDDCLSSRDFEDVVLLLDAREELQRIRRLPTFTYGFEGAIGGFDSRRRMDAVTLPRLERLIESG